MKCWSCGKEVPQAAQRCPHCEAEVMEPVTNDEEEAAAQVLAEMSPDVIAQLQAAFDSSETGEEFVNMVMIGPCPKCGGEKTGDCENDPEIEDPCIGRCFDCGQHWCADCEELFPTALLAAAHECPVWEELEDEFGDDD